MPITLVNPNELPILKFKFVLKNASCAASSPSSQVEELHITSAKYETAAWMAHAEAKRRGMNLAYSGADYLV